MNWSEGWDAARTRMRAGLYILPNFAQGAIPLITLPIISRILSRAEFGVWGVCTAFSAMASAIAGLGLLVGYERNYFEGTEPDAKARLLYSVTAFALIAQLIGFVITLLVSRQVAVRLLHDPGSAHLIYLAYVTAAVPTLKAFFLVFLRNEKRAHEYVHFSVDEMVLGATLSLVAIVWLRVGVLGLIVGPLIASSIVLVVLVRRIRRDLPVSFGRRELTDTLRVSLPLTPRALLGAVGNQLDRLVLGAFGSLEAVGLYTMGQRIASMVFAFMTALQNVYQPVVYRMLFEGGEATSKRIGDFLSPFAFISVAAALTMTLFAAEALRVIASPEYALAAPIVILTSTSYALMFFGKQPQLTFARKTGLVSVLSLLSVILNATCIYIGARIAGATGAAAGLLIANVSIGGTGFFLAQRYAPITYPRLQTLAVLSALPVAAMFSFSLGVSGGSWALAVLLKSAFLATFFVLGWRAGVFAALWQSVGRAVS